ncbi:MAG: sigma 54-interacting transcriptional regulator [Planctomycetota bacterium]
MSENDLGEGNVLFDRYRVVRRLGRGGAGVVFLVEDVQEKGVRKALKQVDLPLDRADAFDLIRSEFEILAKYEHPYLARAFEIGREGDRAYFTMEVVSGTNLLEAMGSRDVPGILRLAIQVLQALAFIHGLGYVHGDVKPQNILVDESGDSPSARLLDFGLAESILEGKGLIPSSSGTPAYFPPERLVGVPPDPRSDLYSFGAMLFQLLTGRLLFRGKRAGEVIEQHRSASPPSLRSIDPSLPADLDRLCLRLLEKEPRLRFPSAEAVIFALAPFVPDLALDSFSREGRHLIAAAFVGREKALSSLAGEIDAAWQGQGSPKLVFLRGPAGMGKSRLAREFLLEKQVKGCRTLETVCPENPQSPLESLGVLLNPLREHIDALDPLLRKPLVDLLEGRPPPAKGVPGGGTAVLAGCLQALFRLASEASPLILLLDDAHLAEPELIDLLFEMGGEGSRGRWAVLPTARERFSHPESEKRVVEAIQAGRCRTVDLEPLGEKEVGAWVAMSLPGAILPAATAKAVASWSGGTPFLVRQALLSGVEEGRFRSTEKGWRYVPPPKGEAFPSSRVETERRFRALSEEEKAVLFPLALHRGWVPLRVIAATLDQPEPASLFPELRRLVRRGWAKEKDRGRAYGLFHESLRRPIWREMGLSRRQDGHRRLAEILESEVQENEAFILMVAEHWARGAEAEKAARWCYRAGWLLEQRWLHRRALLYSRAAKRALDSTGENGKRRAEIDLHIAFITSRKGSPAKAEGIYRSLLQRDLPPSMLAQCHYFMGFTLGRQGRLEEALHAFEECRRILEEENDPKQANRLMDAIAYASHTLNEMGRYEESLALSRKMLSMVPGDSPGRTDGLMAMAWSLQALGRLEEAFAALREALKTCGKKDPTTVTILLQAYSLLGHVRHLQGKMKVAFRWNLLAKRGYKNTASPYGLALSRMREGILAFKMGRPAQAHSQTLKALETFRRFKDSKTVVETTHVLFDQTLTTSRYRHCLSCSASVREWSSRERSPHPGQLQDAKLTRGAFLIRAGRAEEALGELLSMEAAIEKTSISTRIYHGLVKVQGLLACRRFSAATEALRSLEGPVSVHPIFGPQLTLLKARCLVNLDRSRESAALFESALAEAKTMDLLGLYAEGLLHKSQGALAAGEALSAFEAAREAESWCRKTGRISRIWQALHVAGLALEQLEKPRRAAKFLRRASWALEREISAFPEPYRSSFLEKEEVAALLRRIPNLRLEDAALRLARTAALRVDPPEKDWGSIALAWATTCAPLLGADAVTFEPHWSNPIPKEVLVGETQAQDETWRITLGRGGERPLTVTLHRRWERGAPLPVARRIARTLSDRLVLLLERNERGDLAGRFQRVERTMRDKTAEADTALDSARRTITQTQFALGRARGYGEIIGKSKVMEKVYESIRRFGPTEATVLITGESGTGKELAARAIHGASRRRDAPLFAVNCASLAESLLESELFGHERGAFTGAEERKEGLFEIAFGGTLILDEVADMSPRMQAQLLRVLDEGRVRHVGGTETIPIDVRVIALTNRPLDREVKAGRFRVDLLHRLNAAIIQLPPLRDRKDDIPLLAEYFLATFEEGKKPSKISRALAAMLMRYRWPGNVRELRNQVHRAAVLAGKRHLRPEDFQSLKVDVVTKTSLSEGLLLKLREATSRAGVAWERRHEDLFRVLASGGPIRRVEYEKMAKISMRTANRDLERFVALGLIRKEGHGRATTYLLGRLARGKP